MSLILYYIIYIKIIYILVVGPLWRYSELVGNLMQILCLSEFMHVSEKSTSTMFSQLQINFFLELFMINCCMLYLFFKSESWQK